MCGSGVGHSKDPTCWLKGGSLGGSPMNELPLSESPGCLLFGSWWLERMGT
jgi:hypothetical protein